MATSRIVEVADQLLQRAKAGKVPWQKADGKDTYLVSFPEISLGISRLSWLPGPPPAPPGLPSLPDLRSISAYGYRLELFDESGAMIGSMAATGGDPQHKVLREIFELAEGTCEVPEGKESDLEVGINKALEHLKGG